MATQDAHLRIGELARRTGVSPETLRAWERRYGLLQPARTSGGFRLYGTADLVRIERMRSLIEEGVSAAEAAGEVLRGGGATAVAPAPGASLLDERRADLHARLAAFDEAGAQVSLDQLFAGFPLEAVMRDVLIPQMREIGEMWARGELNVAEEHFASNLVRARLAALTRDWDEGAGPRALLACPDGEAHDLPLLMFGIALRRRGWRITYLGAETPGDSLADAAARLVPDVIVLAATRTDCFTAVSRVLRKLARSTRLMIAGAGATDRLASSLGASFLDTDPVSAATLL